MNLQNVIGIDPDSSGFEIVLFKNNEIVKPVKKHFSISHSDLCEFKEMVRGLENVVIAIEGSNGYSQPIEETLRKDNIIFYSFKPSAVSQYRKSVLGQNKNNKIDAEATARYAIALAAQGILEKNRRVWFADDQLQFLTRLHTKRIKQKTADVNELWKIIHHVSADLYLALKGDKKAEKRGNNKIIQSNAILSLLYNVPDIGNWKGLSEDELRKQMNLKQSSKMIFIFDLVKQCAASLPQISLGFQLIIKHAAERIFNLKKEAKAVESLIAEKLSDDQFIKLFTAKKGIGILTAAKAKAEIIDIRRFADDDHLASYAGLCLKDKSTGTFNSGRNSNFFSHRLKDIFMTAVKNYIKFNPDTHIAGYYRNLIKHRKMKHVEARKRAARAFVRTVFKDWESVIELQYLQQNRKEIKKEGNMAQGQLPHNLKIKSNILPSFEQSSIKKDKKQEKKREKVLI